MLSPPTLPALREELDRARRTASPITSSTSTATASMTARVGLGGLCFEDPEDIGKLDKRRHVTVYTNELGPLLRDHRIPLVFLEACQTAQAEKASESVASELLKVGVASVVAMSHSVLVETARRFVEAFYDALARGARVGDAMLDGQRQLKDDTFRGRIFGAGELRLEDWFVPVLFQEKDDPQLFRTTPAQQTQEDSAGPRSRPASANCRRSRRPASSAAAGSCSRSSGCCAHEALRRGARPGRRRQDRAGRRVRALDGPLASDAPRRVRLASRRTATSRAVLDAIGRQLVPDYSVATFDDLEKAILPVERALASSPRCWWWTTWRASSCRPIVETPEALSEEARRELDAILALCARLNAKGDTRLVFTSREALPAPFDAERHRRELHQLDREDAVKLVERVLNREAAGAGAAADAAREEIEQLVDAVHGHARTLALLAPALRSRGVEATRASLVELMAEMERKFPGSREKSVFASVELSLRRMSPANRDGRACSGCFTAGSIWTCSA